MSCGCKDNNIQENGVDSITRKPNSGLFNKILNKTVRVITFLISLLTLPLIVIISIYMLFTTLVLDKQFDLVKGLTKIANKLKKKNKDEENDDTEFDDIDLEDVELVGVDDLDKKGV